MTFYVELLMNKFIRTTALLSFICLTFIFVGCNVSEAELAQDQQNKKTRKTLQMNSNRPKIIAFGDSLTAGFGLSKKESYPYLLQKRLDSEGFNYEVIDAGVSGDTSLGGLERIDWVLGQKNIKILILELGANDMLRNIPVAQMKSNLEKIILKAKAKNIEVLFCGMLASPSMGREYQTAFISAFPDLASKHKVKFVAFLLEGVALDPKLNQADGIHPNPKGAKIMTSNIYKGLKPMLKK